MISLTQSSPDSGGRYLRQNPYRASQKSLEVQFAERLVHKGKILACTCMECGATFFAQRDRKYCILHTLREDVDDG